MLHHQDGIILFWIFFTYIFFFNLMKLKKWIIELRLIKVFITSESVVIELYAKNNYFRSFDIYSVTSHKNYPKYLCIFIYIILLHMRITILFCWVIQYFEYFLYSLTHFVIIFSYIFCMSYLKVSLFEIF